MKKIYLFATLAILAGPGVQGVRADLANIPDHIEPVFNVWGGFNLVSDREVTRTSAAELRNLPEAGSRVASSHASEYYAMDNSLALGFLYEAERLPNRTHLELDIANRDEFFGDFRYSYLDTFQGRLLSRRMFHNLDNTALFDFSNTGSTRIRPLDLGFDNYGLGIDIDQFRLRLKTPNFPLHVYSDGEMVTREGEQQLRFWGGALPVGGGYTAASSATRVSQVREIDQRSKEISLGANAHLNPVEVDFAHGERRFDTDAASVLPYAYNAYSNAANGSPAGTFNHNGIPVLTASSNTMKIHSSHTGNIYASATFAQIDKSNETSGAEAKNTMSFGDLSWLLRSNLLLATKLRHQVNEASAPSSVTNLSPTDATKFYSAPVEPGVESTTDTATATLRYTPLPKLNLKAQYSKSIKDVEDPSGLNWMRPSKAVTDSYELGANWRALAKLKLNGKLVHKDIRTKFEQLLVVNNDPEESNQGVMGLTYSISPWVTALANANVTKERTNDNAMDVDIPIKHGEAIREQYMGGLNFSLTEKLSLNPAYTFMSYQQNRDIWWANGGTPAIPTYFVDSNYNNNQTAHNFALNLLFVPSKVMQVSTSLDYTITEGFYDPTDSFTIYSATGVAQPRTLTDLAGIAKSDTKEWNLRVEGKYDLGNGWGTGLELRYADWSDQSFDNPSDSSAFRALLKVTKKLMGPM